MRRFGKDARERFIRIVVLDEDGGCADAEKCDVGGAPSMARRPHDDQRREKTPGVR
jgi:hypothetical protein